MPENLNPPDIRDLLAAIAKEWGGMESLARQIVDDVKAAPKGSSQRLSYHYHYLTALSRCTNVTVAEQYDPEELEALNNLRQ